MELNKHQLQLFDELTQINAIAGNENDVAKYLKKHYTQLGYPIVFDNLGSIIAVKKSKNPNAKRVFVVGHMDEVGFIVNYIDRDGFIKVSPIGGFNVDTLLSSRVILKTKSGKNLKGTIMSLPPHLVKNNASKVEINELFFDFGFTSMQEAIDAGVYYGAMVVMEGKFEQLENKERLLTKAVDDRYGLVLGLEILEELKDVDLDYDLYVGGSVQEEVGSRGAMTSSYLINPDIAIVLDCSPARDMGGSSDAQGKLGEGVLIRFLDRSMIAFQELIDLQIKACEEAKIKYQYYESPGSTDASNIHKTKEGVLTLTHCICARGIHTCSTIFDSNDYLAAKNSLITLLKNLNSNKIEQIKGVRK